jgi:hypothetical protein
VNHTESLSGFVAARLRLGRSLALPCKYNLWGTYVWHPQPE